MKYKLTQEEIINQIQEAKRFLNVILKEKALILANLKQHSLKQKHYQKIILNLAEELKKLSEGVE